MLLTITTGSSETVSLLKSLPNPPPRQATVNHRPKERTKPHGRKKSGAKADHTNQTANIPTIPRNSSSNPPTTQLIIRPGTTTAATHAPTHKSEIPRTESQSRRARTTNNTDAHHRGFGARLPRTQRISGAVADGRARAKAKKVVVVGRMGGRDKLMNRAGLACLVIAILFERNEEDDRIADCAGGKSNIVK